MVLSAVNSMLSSNDFKISSPEARKAVEIAAKVISCTSKEVDEFTMFSKRLVEMLMLCFRTTKRSFISKQEAMWESFHKLRTSAKFKKEWQDFFNSSIGQPTVCPTFVQYVTNQVFLDLVKNHHQIPEATFNDESSNPITSEESQALRYVAGYICRKIQHKIDTSPSFSQGNKKDMVLFLSELKRSDQEEDSLPEKDDLEVDSLQDKDDEEIGEKTWIERINRGGLWEVNENTYLLFHMMEDEVQHHLTIKSLKEKNDQYKRESVLGAICKSEEVKIQWTQLSSHAYR